MTEEEIQKLLKQHQGRDVVAWRFWSGDWQYVCDRRMLHHLTDDVFVEPLFLAPNKWQGLTGEELRNIAREFKGNTQRRFEDHWDEIVAFVREAEAKLKEKNT